MLTINPGNPSSSNSPGEDLFLASRPAALRGHYKEKKYLRMTYCVGIRLEQGLVFCSDSRTNAGPDRVSTYSKLHRFSIAGERQLMLMTAGNLATSQAVVAQIERDLREDAAFNVAKGTVRIGRRGLHR